MFYYAKMARSQWILQQLGMMALVGSQIWWTWEVTDVFDRVRKGNKLAMKEFSGKLTGQLMELTTMVRGDLSNLNRKKINQLIIIDVHARDIIDTFVRDSVLDAASSRGSLSFASPGPRRETTSRSISARASSTSGTNTWGSTGVWSSLD